MIFGDKLLLRSCHYRGQIWLFLSSFTAWKYVNSHCKHFQVHNCEICASYGPLRSTLGIVHFFLLYRFCTYYRWPLGYCYHSLKVCKFTIQQYVKICTFGSHMAATHYNACHFVKCHAFAVIINSTPMHFVEQCVFALSCVGQPFKVNGMPNMLSRLQIYCFQSVITQYISKEQIWLLPVDTFRSWFTNHPYGI